MTADFSSRAASLAAEPQNASRPWHIQPRLDPGPERVIVWPPSEVLRVQQERSGPGVMERLRVGFGGLYGPLWNLRREPGLLLVPAVLFVASAFGTAATSGPILCLFRLMSGIPCAGCGMTRAFVAIGHGYPAAAIDYNPLSPIAWLWMVVWWLLAVIYLLRGLRVPTHPDWLLKSGLVVLVGWWTLRAVVFLTSP